MLRLDALRDVAQNHGVAARKIVSRQGEVHDDLRTIVTNEFRTAVLTYLPLMLAYRDFFSLVLLRFFLFRDDRAERLAVNSGQSGGGRQMVMVLVRVPVFCGA